MILGHILLFISFSQNFYHFQTYWNGENHMHGVENRPRHLLEDYLLNFFLIIITIYWPSLVSFKPDSLCLGRLGRRLALNIGWTKNGWGRGSLHIPGGLLSASLNIQGWYTMENWVGTCSYPWKGPRCPHVDDQFTPGLCLVQDQSISSGAWQPTGLSRGVPWQDRHPEV